MYVVVVVVVVVVVIVVVVIVVVIVNSNNNNNFPICFPGCLLTKRRHSHKVVRKIMALPF